MESNPNFEKKDDAPKISQDDVRDAVRSSLSLVGNVARLSALIEEDASFVECSDAERASLSSVTRIFNQMTESAQEGSSSFQDSRKTADFADTFEKLSRSSSDTVTDGGVTFEELNAFVSRSFSDNAQILQRISDKALAAKREAAAQEKAERQAAAEAQEAKKQEEAPAKEAEPEEANAEAEVEESKDTSEVKDEAAAEDQPEGKEVATE